MNNLITHKNFVGLLALVNGVWSVNCFWNGAWVWGLLSGFFAVLCFKSYRRED